MMTEATLELRKLTDFVPDRANANKGTQRGLSLLEDSIAEDGAGRSMLATADGVLIAGNKTQAALIERGIEEVIVVHTDGTRAVIVQRDDVKAGTPHAQRMGVRDNRSSQVGLDWDIDVLGELDIDLGDLFFDSELAEMGIGLEEQPEDPGPQIDKAAELQEKWQVARGQIWTVGPHRIMCGDSMSAEDVARLMGGGKAALCVADPPYGVDYDPSWRGEDLNQTVHGEAIQGDKDFAWLAAFEIVPADVLYVWLASNWLATVQMGIEKYGFETRYLIIWNKDLAVMGRGNYHWKHEPCLYMVREGHATNWQGARDQKTVWDIATIHSFKRGHNSEEWGLLGHSNQKPIECMERPILNNSDRGETVYDPFLGSGTTMVAAEQTGRICYGMEIEPKYCSVTLERMSGIGLEPRLSE